MADPSYQAKVIGEVVIDIEINDQLYVGLTPLVMKNMITDIIIGKDFMTNDSSVTFNFGGRSEPLVFGAIKPTQENNPTSKSEPIQIPVETLPNDDTMGKMKVVPPPLFTGISKNCKPIAEKTRRFTPEKIAFIKQEITKLHDNGIIEPSISPWRSQIHVTKEDGHHRQRMCVDYSNTVNIHTPLDAYPMPNIHQYIDNISKFKIFSTFDLKSAFHQIPISEEDRKFTAFEADGKLWQYTTVPCHLV